MDSNQTYEACLEQLHPSDAARLRSVPFQSWAEHKILDSELLLSQLRALLPATTATEAEPVGRGGSISSDELRQPGLLTVLEDALAFIWDGYLHLPHLRSEVSFPTMQERTLFESRIDSKV